MKKMPRALAVAGALISSIVIFQAARGSAVSDGSAVYIELFGGLVNKNGMASILLYGVVSSAWLAVNGKRRYWILCIYQIAVTFYIGARSATLVAAVMVVSVALAVSPNRRSILLRIVGFGLAIAVAAITIVQSGMFADRVSRMAELVHLDANELTAASSRLLLWNAAWEEFVRSPWIGHGNGTFSYSGGNWLDGMYEPHNSVLQVLYSGGVVGMFCFSGLIFFGFMKGDMRRKKLCLLLLAAYLLNSMVGIIWIRGDGHLFWLIFFLMAIAPAGDRHVRDIKPANSHAFRVSPTF
ncbi:O-antigen ligase family protein [Lysobacter sp. UC]|uniref:O-antigen ligase family protein n=2 Tax=Lysobacter arvi TaxID=3038776 RepID=A0ABU1C906_9GAMM|nr:O-antigen ligase family protein [Lysobacter arvi]